MECEKIIQTFTPLLRKSLIDNMEPERRVRLHKFNSLRCRRQAYPCTVTNKEVYKKKRFFLGNESPEIFATDEYIFIYEYGDYGEKQCITRINRDGSNPILVMDENGEIVMKPVQ